MSAALKDFASNALVSMAVPPGTHTADITGDTLDMVSSDGECFAIQQVSTFSGDTLAGSIEESANGSTGWTAIPDATFGSVDSGSDIQTINFKRTYRYVRYVANLEGDTPSVVVAVAIGAMRKYL